MLTALLLSGAGAVCADTPSQPWKANASFNYYSGNYGEDQKTQTTLIPVKLTRFFSAGDVWLTIPYVSVTGHGTVTTFSGGPHGQRRVKTTDVENTNSGLGDTVLGAHRIFLREQNVIPEIGASVFIKAPTANESKGLGTGQWDEGTRLELFKSLPQHWFGMMDLGYTFVGNSPNTDYNNKWLISLGAGHPIAPRLTGAMFLTETRALISGNDNPIDLTFTLNFAATTQAALYTGILIGLSDGSPDTGFSLGGSVRFGEQAAVQPPTSKPSGSSAAPNSKATRFPLGNY